MNLTKQILLLTCFQKLGGGYNGENSIFDNIKKEDLIFAFFPCTRFEAKIPLSFRGESYQQKNWTDEQKLEYSMNLHKELHELYTLLSQMVTICIRKGLKLIIENPHTQPHYLTTYWCIKPKLIDKDRTMNGDFYKKPTQYWFINCEPKNNLVWEPLDYVEQKTISHATKEDGKSRQTIRSMIHPQYANRFIRQYIIDKEE